MEPHPLKIFYSKPHTASWAHEEILQQEDRKQIQQHKAKASRLIKLAEMGFLFWDFGPCLSKTHLKITWGASEGDEVESSNTPGTNYEARMSLLGLLSSLLPGSNFGH